MERVQSKKQIREYMSFFNIVKEKAVNDCFSLDDFLNKYRLNSRYKQRDGAVWGLDYSKNIYNSHLEELSKRGYTSISCYESTTGKAEYYINATYLTKQ